MPLCKDIWQPKHSEKLLKLHLPNKQLKVAANTTDCLFLLCAHTHTHTDNILYIKIYIFRLQSTREATHPTATATYLMT